jgi:hypothetical protein
MGMHEKKWSVAGEAPGRILARIPVRTHVAEVLITYDSEWIRFAYHGSQGLNYRPDPDQGQIHPVYNRWVANLRQAIASSVAFAETAAERPAQPAFSAP